MGLLKHYAPSGEYMGLTFLADGWWFGEDRLGIAKGHETELLALAWIKKRFYRIMAA